MTSATWGEGVVCQIRTQSRISLWMGRKGAKMTVVDFGVLSSFRLLCDSMKMPSFINSPLKEKLHACGILICLLLFLVPVTTAEWPWGKDFQTRPQFVISAATSWYSSWEHRAIFEAKSGLFVKVTSTDNTPQKLTKLPFVFNSKYINQ